MRELCDERRLRRVRDEIVNNIDATFKETDLFKVLQTGDLKNMDELPPEQAGREALLDSREMPLQTLSQTLAQAEQTI